MNESASREPHDVLTTAENKAAVTGAEIIKAIAATTAANLPPRGFGKLASMLIWSLDEERGNSIFVTLKSWLEGDDERLASYALFTEDFYFYDSTEEMADMFDKLSLRFPSLKTEANKIVQQRRSQEEATRKNEIKIGHRRP